MDIYYKFISKIYEETGGKDSKAVDLAEMVKREGFYGNYSDIYKELSDRAWIIETGKTDWIKITHWGIKEAKRAESGDFSGERSLREANLLLSESQELTTLIEEFIKDSSIVKIEKLEKKTNELNKILSELKTNF